MWTAPTTRIGNEDVAEAMDRIGDLLEVQDANPFRVRAYRRAADAVRVFDFSVTELARTDGLRGLEALPAIGSGLARLIESFARTGRIELLDRLEGQICPEDLLRTVPGIGPRLASRIHRELDVETLEELEVAAHDGRLATLKGFGPRRVRQIRETLAGMLGQASRRRSLRFGGPTGVVGEGTDRESPEARVSGVRAAEVRGSEVRDGGSEDPAVALLLDIDFEYRARAKEDSLPRIAPRRFNPSGARWLPILHTERDGRPFTALFSNTARAHELERTHDWVVIYADGSDRADRFTVVTEYSGPLSGRRVVRGREADCVDYYDRSAQRTGRPAAGVQPA